MPGIKVSKLTQQDTLDDTALIPVTSRGGKTRAISFKTLKTEIQAQVSKGDTGETGAQGTAGTDGILGADGINGIDGAQGLAGNIGAQGEQGIQGIAGTYTGAELAAILNTFIGHSDWQLAGGGPVGETDTTAPVVTAPIATTISYSNGAGGLAHSDATLTAWLVTGVSALDDTDGAISVTNNLSTFSDPITANTTITFTATDAAGNVGTAQALLTIEELPAQTSAVYGETITINNIGVILSPAVYGATITINNIEIL